MLLIEREDDVPGAPGALPNIESNGTGRLRYGVRRERAAHSASLSAFRCSSVISRISFR